MERQLTLSKKSEDNKTSKIHELNFECEKLRESDIDASFVSTNSYNNNSGLIQELELKIQSLISQNETLKNGNQESINAKYIELENSLLEQQMKNNSLEQQIEMEKDKNKKLMNDFEQMGNVIDQGESDKKEISDGSFTALQIKCKKLEAKIRDMEHYKKESHDLK